MLYFAMKENVFSVFFLIDSEKKNSFCSDKEKLLKIKEISIQDYKRKEVLVFI